jgi:hypothetical protein
MKIATQIGAILALLVCSTSGCQLFSKDHPSLKGRSPLQAAQSSPDSVAMEIVWARFPADNPVMDDAAWREIDETQIDPTVRRELMNNGLRAGIITGSMPPAIAKVVHQSSRSESVDDVIPGNEAKSQTAELLTDPVVHGRRCSLRRKQRTEIQASDVYPSLPLLVRGGAELGGRPYEQAQAIYALRVDPQPDRTAVVEITPELHHGAMRLRYTGGGDDGMPLRQASLKDREVFDRLRVSVKLAPGELLVLMSLPDAGSQLGHYFHTVESADGPQQKLILIRLAEVPPSDTFADTNDL